MNTLQGQGTGAPGQSRDLKPFLLVVDRRRTGWSLVPEVAVALDDATSILSNPADSADNARADPAVLKRYLDCWKILSRTTDHWEITSLGLLVIQFVISNGLYRGVSTTGSREHGALTDEFVVAVEDTVKELIVHEEPRIRGQVTDVVKSFVSLPVVDGHFVYHDLAPSLIARVKLCWQRQETSFQPSFSHGASTAAGPSGVAVSMSLDDTTGWKDLETSLRCLQGLILTLANKPGFNIKSEISDEVFSLTISQPAQHLNRYVRQSSLEFGAEFLRTAAFSDGTELVTWASELADRIAEAVSLALDDDWGQLRLAGCLCAAAYYEVFPPVFTERQQARLLPRICLNRFFAAAGVQEAAMVAWKAAVGSRGAALLSQLISAAVAYDIASSKAKNHEISEAAISALSELLLKLTEPVSTHVLDVATALSDSLGNSSWPIRDAACAASGVLVSLFPAVLIHAAPGLLDAMITAWFKHLRDAIWSIRKNALTAIESALASGNADVVDTLLSRINGFLADNLKLGPVPSKSFLPRAMLSSRIAAVEATSGRLGSGWGCCIDCITERESSPVETAMSASSLLRALWLAGRRDSAALHMTQFWELVSQKREIGGEKMIVHMLEQLAEMISSCAEEEDYKRLLLQQHEPLLASLTEDKSKTISDAALTVRSLLKYDATQG